MNSGIVYLGFPVVLCPASGSFSPCIPVHLMFQQQTLITLQQISLALSLHIFPFSSAQPYKFQRPQPPNFLISIFLMQEDHTVLGFVLLVLHSGKCPLAESRGGPRAHLTCFPAPEIPILLRQLSVTVNGCLI